MDLLTYLMAKKKKKIFPHKSDLLACLLSKSTWKYFYQTFTGTILSVDNTVHAPMRIELGASEISQAGTPTPSSPQDIHTISGSNKVVVSNSDNTLSQEAEVDLDDIEYCKIGNYEDKIFKNIPTFSEYDNTLVEGAWYIKKNIGKLVLDGTENWDTINDVAGSSGTISQVGLTMSFKTRDGLSNRFSVKANYSATEHIVIAGGLGKLYVQILKTRLSTADITGFKSWLSTNNTELYYILATPTYTQITGTLAEQLENVYQKMLSYTGTTNISQVNNDLPFILECEIAIKNY